MLTRSRLTFGPKSRVEAWTVIGLVATLLFFLISGLIAYLNIQVIRENSDKIRHTHAVLIALDELLSATQDAETGQRGYLLTGDGRYLAWVVNEDGYSRLHARELATGRSIDTPHVPDGAITTLRISLSRWARCSPLRTR